MNDHFRRRYLQEQHELALAMMRERDSSEFSRSWLGKACRIYVPIAITLFFWAYSLELLASHFWITLTLLVLLGLLILKYGKGSRRFLFAGFVSSPIALHFFSTTFF